MAEFSVSPHRFDPYKAFKFRGPLDGPTVPARRPITVHDVLTFRWGSGWTSGRRGRSRFWRR